MTEWGVVGVIVVVLGIIATVFTISDRYTKPTKDLTVAVATLTVTMNTLTEQLKKLDEDNDKEHLALWNKYEEEADTLSEHEARLRVIESKGA